MRCECRTACGGLILDFLQPMPTRALARWRYSQRQTLSYLGVLTKVSTGGIIPGLPGVRHAGLDDVALAQPGVITARVLQRPDRSDIPVQARPPRPSCAPAVRVRLRGWAPRPAEHSSGEGGQNQGSVVDERGTASTAVLRFYIGLHGFPHALKIRAAKRRNSTCQNSATLHFRPTRTLSGVVDDLDHLVQTVGLKAS
jgi:hypothetical protein